MSNRELDNLFKNKLDELEVRPSADSWKKIQGNLTQERKRGGWFYAGIAAAIVLLAVFTGIFLFNNTKEQPEKQIALKHENTVKNSVKDSSLPDKVEQAEEKDKNPHSDSSEKRNEGQVHRQAPVQVQKKKAGKPDTDPLKINEARSAVHEDQVAMQEPAVKKDVKDLSPVEDPNKKLITATDATNETAIASTEQKQQSEGQTLVFNIEDFNARTAVASANKDDKEKRSALKKVLDFARSVKEGDGGLAELREAKNELFALNFKKENDNSK